MRQIVDYYKHKTDHADCSGAYFVTPDCGILISFLREEAMSHLRQMPGQSKSADAVYSYGSLRQTSQSPMSSLSWSPNQVYTCNVKQHSWAPHYSL